MFPRVLGFLNLPTPKVTGVKVDYSLTVGFQNNNPALWYGFVDNTGTDTGSITPNDYLGNALKSFAATTVSGNYNFFVNIAGELAIYNSATITVNGVDYTLAASIIGAGTSGASTQFLIQGTDAQTVYNYFVSQNGNAIPVSIKGNLT